MKKRHYLNALLRSICIVLILILLLPSLSACNGAPNTMEEWEKRLRVSNNCLCLHKVSFSIPNELWDHYLLSVPSTYKDPDFAYIDVEKYSYRGVEYTLERPVSQKLEYSCGERIYSLAGKNDEGETLYVSYTDEKKAPLYYSPCKPYGKEREQFVIEDAIKVAEDFIDHVVNDSSKDRIDISKYILKSTEFNSQAQIINFVRYVNGIPVHTVTVKINEKCQAYDFWMSTPILEERVYRMIPEITDEQYREMSLGIIEKIYQYDHESFTISDFSIDAKLNVYGYDFKYSHNEESYVITFAPKFNITLADGTFEEGPKFLLSYVLDPKTESEGE